MDRPVRDFSLILSSDFLFFISLLHTQLHPPKQFLFISIVYILQGMSVLQLLFF